MAISVLDVRETTAPIPVAARRRPPASVVAAAGLALLESVALLAGALTGLDGVLTSSRPDGAVVVLVLLALATWIVLCAGGGATLVDAAGRRLLTWVAYGELALITVLLAVALLTPASGALLPRALPLPAVALLVLAVPTGKLLLAGSPAALAWVAAGPRPRERRPDPVAAHRGLCTATLAVIGALLGVLALVAPAAGTGSHAPGSVASSTR